MIEVKVIPLPVSSEIARELADKPDLLARWSADPHEETVVVPQIAVGTHIFIGDQDWLVKRVSVIANERATYAHCTLNGLCGDGPEWK